MLFSDYLEIKIHILSIFHCNLVVAMVMFAESQKNKVQLFSSCKALRANISMKEKIPIKGIIFHAVHERKGININTDLFA